MALFAAALLSLLYTAPKIPWQPARWLQRIAYGKTIFLSLAWTYITVLLPILLTHSRISDSQLTYCVNRFFLIYAICILFDLRDRESDRSQGIKSMITQFGLPAVTRLYYGTLAAFFCSVAPLLLSMPPLAVAALSAPGIVLLFSYNWFAENPTDITYYLLLDGLTVFSLPMLLLFGF